MTDEERRAAGWKPFSEPIIVPPNGRVYWIEDDHGYKIISDPTISLGPWPAESCYVATSGINGLVL